MSRVRWALPVLAIATAALALLIAGGALGGPLVRVVAAALAVPPLAEALGHVDARRASQSPGDSPFLHPAKETTTQGELLGHSGHGV